MTSTTQPDIAIPSMTDAAAAIRILFRPDQVIELRGIGSGGAGTIKRFTLSGYYSDHTKMAADVIAMSNTPGVSGVYWTIQKINPALLARSANRYRRGPEATTADTDVIEYMWLPVDADPVRPAGISSTDAEKAAALGVILRVSLFFQELGVTPIQADSGNGYHLLVPISLAVGLAPLVKDVLAALAARFDTEDVKIDRTVFNRSRILKCYGSMARKGESTAERPHRAACLLNPPDVVPECLGMDILQKIADGAQSSEKRKRQGEKPVDVDATAALMEQFLTEGGVNHGPRVDYMDGFKWLLDTCPFNIAHVNPSIIVTVAETGAMGFKCSHNSCSDQSWPHFRKYVEAGIGHPFVFSATASSSNEILQWLDDLIADKDRKMVCPSLSEMAQHCSELSDEEYAERRRALAKRMNVSAKDLDAAVAKCRKHAADESASSFDPSVITTDAVRKIVEGLLDDEPSEGDKKQTENVIWAYLRTHARVFCCNGQGYFLMSDGDGVPIDVSPDSQEFNKLLISFGVHPGSPTRSRIGEFVETQCFHTGVQTETRLGFHFDPETFTAYVARDRGWLIKVTRWGLEEVRNGEDDELFIFPPNWRPLLTRPLNDVGGIIGTDTDFPKSDLCRRALFVDGFLAKNLFGGTAFQIRSMSEAQVRILIMSYLLFLTMPGVVSERAMLQTLGPSSSGKTFLLELIGFILVGPKFSPRPLPVDIREFENQLINEFFITYDNVSKVPREIRDRFCQAVTGIEIIRRVLFTDKREMREVSKATISLSAIEPPLPELEHANRTITINFGERPEGSFVAKEELLKVVARNRDDIILNLLRRMTLALEALYAERDYVPKVNVRLASVGTFIIRVARHEGWEDKASELLKAWGTEQTGYSLVDDDVSTALVRWMGRDGWKANVELTATMLNEQLCIAMGCNREKNRTNRQELSWRGNPLVLAGKLSRNLKVYALRFGLERQLSTLRNTRGGWTYKFNPGNKLLGDVTAEAQYERDNLEDPELPF